MHYFKIFILHIGFIIDILLKLLRKNITSFVITFVLVIINIFILLKKILNLINLYKT